jgi:Transport and Golgi organisation 2
MCLLALFYRVAEDAPVVVGANREEFYARGGEPPRLFAGSTPFVAGVDPAAGGTWFGVNARGVVIAVTNRPLSETPKTPRSRGLLVRDLLELPTAKQAADTAAHELDRKIYAGCNLLCVDATHALVLHHGDWLRVRMLPPGLHLLANRDVNDESDERIGYAAHWLNERPYRFAEHCLVALRQLCGLHEPGMPAMCFRHEKGGTVSSSLVALRTNFANSAYLHAQGPPDRTPYSDYSQLLRDAASGEKLLFP